MNIEYGKTTLGLIMQNQFQSKKITIKRFELLSCLPSCYDMIPIQVNVCFFTDEIDRNSSMNPGLDLKVFCSLIDSITRVDVTIHGLRMDGSAVCWTHSESQQ